MDSPDSVLACRDWTARREQTMGLAPSNYALVCDALSLSLSHKGCAGGQHGLRFVDGTMQCPSLDLLRRADGKPGQHDAMNSAATSINRASDGLRAAGGDRIEATRYNGIS